jgi:hypothetical protein
LQGRGTSEAGGGVFFSAYRSLPASVDYVRHYAVEIVPHIRGPDPHCVDAATGKPFVSVLVALRILAEFVRQSVHFNSERRLVTEEVEIVGAVLVLLAELEAVRALLERVP